MSENYIYVEIPDDEQYDELRRIKKRHGLTWRGLLLQGAGRMNRVPSNFRRD